MAFMLKIGGPYNATATYRQAPADIQDLRQNIQWQHRRPIIGYAVVSAMASMLVIALGLTVSSFPLRVAMRSGVYDMTPTGSIQKASPDKALKAKNCD